MKLKSPTGNPVHVAMLDGTSIQIGPGGRDVPVHFRKTAFAKGCIPVDSTVEQMDEPDAEPTELSRPDRLRQVCQELKDEDTPLTGAGLPNINTVRARAGWNVTAVELTDAWNSLE